MVIAAAVLLRLGGDAFYFCGTDSKSPSMNPSDMPSMRRALPKSSCTLQSGHFLVPPEPSALAAVLL